MISCPHDDDPRSCPPCNAPPLLTNRWDTLATLTAAYPGLCPYGDAIEPGDRIVLQRRVRGGETERRYVHDTCL